MIVWIAEIIQCRSHQRISSSPAFRARTNVRDRRCYHSIFIPRIHLTAFGKTSA
jgi:hypothetical protein